MCKNEVSNRTGWPWHETDEHEHHDNVEFGVCRLIPMAPLWKGVQGDTGVAKPTKALEVQYALKISHVPTKINTKSAQRALARTTKKMSRACCKFEDLPLLGNSRDVHFAARLLPSVGLFAKANVQGYLHKPSQSAGGILLLLLATSNTHGIQLHLISSFVSKTISELIGEPINREIALINSSFKSSVTRHPDYLLLSLPGESGLVDLLPDEPTGSREKARPLCILLCFLLWLSAGTARMAINRIPKNRHYHPAARCGVQSAICFSSFPIFFQALK